MISRRRGIRRIKRSNTILSQASKDTSSSNPLSYLHRATPPFINHQHHPLSSTSSSSWSSLQSSMSSPYIAVVLSYLVVFGPSCHVSTRFISSHLMSSRLDSTRLDSARLSSPCSLASYGLPSVIMVFAAISRAVLPTHT